MSVFKDNWNGYDGNVGEYLCVIPIGKERRNNMINEDLRLKRMH